MKIIPELMDTCLKVIAEDYAHKAIEKGIIANEQDVEKAVMANWDKVQKQAMELYIHSYNKIREQAA